MKKANRRGFTLIEVMVAAGLVAGFATMSVPLLGRLQRAQQFRSIARNVQANMMYARNVATSGKRSSTWSGNERVQQAGILINSTTSYSVFIDRNAVRDGDEITIRTVVLPLGMEITSPAAGQEIRIRHTGTIAAPQNIVLNDRHRNKSRTVVVSGGGATRID